LVTEGFACAGEAVNRVPARAATISTDNAVVRRTIITPPRVQADLCPDDNPASRAEGRVTLSTMDADDTPSRGRKVTNAAGVSKVW
jgi:hypothetical protein